MRQPDAPAPKVVVDQSRYDFNTLDLASAGSHEFVFSNAGKAPLKLAAGQTSCRCTMSSIEEKEIPPGGSTKVKITWKSNDRPGPFEQTAKILTNDPKQPEITLTISGRSWCSVKFRPPRHRPPRRGCWTTWKSR
jgi:hypothetical protein